MKRLAVLIAALTWAACSETKVPPTGPQPAKPGGPGPDRVEIDDPGPGGGGQPGDPWDYVWVPGGTVNTNYGTNGGQTTAASQEVWNYANQQFKWRVQTFPPGDCDDLIPHLINQTSDADQLALAKAVVYYCDGTVPPLLIQYADPNCPGGVCDETYYDEVWHAIRNMMKDWYANAALITAYQTPCHGNPATENLRENGWIGMGRNLMGYMIAADYLMSLGPVGNRGYKSNDPGDPYYNNPLSNSSTRDSLKSFVRSLLDQSGCALMASNSPDGEEDNWLGYDFDPTCTGVGRSGMASQIPDNKGAAAMASFATALTLSINMASNPPANWPQGSGGTSNLALWDSLTHWVKGWAGDRGPAGKKFALSRFSKGNDDCDPNTPGVQPCWANSYVQEDSLDIPPNQGGPVPILGPDECVKWPLPADGHICDHDECCHWGVGSIGNQMVNGLPVNDMMRGPDPKSTCTDCVDPEAPPPLLVTELHVAGVISYLVNTLEVMYQEGTSLYAHNGSRIPQAAIFYDYWAGQYNCSGQSGCGWDYLRDNGDDWPCTYILSKRGYAITAGTASERREGKQMSFTDLTHM